MFEFVQRHTKIIQFMLFLLIVPSFVAVSLDGYNRMRDTSTEVAVVAGDAITSAEYEAAHRADVERMRLIQPDVDVKTFDNDEFKKNSLERLVMQKVQALAAKDNYLVISNAALTKALQQDPNIAALVKPDGKIDKEGYAALVASSGMTPEQYEARIRADLASRQVFMPMYTSSVSAQPVTDLVTKAFLQQREVQVLQIKPTDFTAQINPTDAEVETYYKNHSVQFQIPEQVGIEYVVLDVEGLKKSVTVTDADLKKYYDDNKAKLVGPEERRASHILIAAGKSAPAAERATAKAKAVSLQAQVVKAPNTFAEVAKANSQDPGSAVNGGDLSYFGRGAMVKPFEEATFALNVGEISGVVESDFGFHIIKLTDIKKPDAKSLDQLKPEIDSAVREQIAKQKFAENAEKFKDMVFDQNQPLNAVADSLKLSVQTASNVNRQAAKGVKGALGNQKFLSAIFSTESLAKKANTEVVEIGSSQLAAGRVVQYAPAKVAALADVKDRAKALLIQSLAEDLAKKEGVKKLAEFKGATDASKLPAPVVVSRNKPEGQTPKVLDAALSVDPTQLPAVVGVELGPQGYAVVRVTKVIQDGAIDAAQQKQFGSQISQAWSNSEVLAYFEVLKARYKVEIKPKATATVDAEKK